MRRLVVAYLECRPVCARHVLSAGEAMDIPFNEDGTVDLERIKAYCQKHAEQFAALEQEAAEKIGEDELDWAPAASL